MQCKQMCKIQYVLHAMLKKYQIHAMYVRKRTSKCENRYVNSKDNSIKMNALAISGQHALNEATRCCTNIFSMLH